MPLYLYECEPCGSKVEALQSLGTTEKDCPECGEAMAKRPTCQSLVLMNRLVPSFRNEYLGSAPYSTAQAARPKGNIVSQSPETIEQGQKWLRTIE